MRLTLDCLKVKSTTEYQRRISDYKWSLRLQECCLVTLFLRKDPVWPVSAI